MIIQRYGVMSISVFVLVGLAAYAGQQPDPAGRPQTPKPADVTPGAPKPGEDAKTILAVDPTTFQIGAEDVLAIQVWREPDFSRQVIVRPDGKITMPLVGEVQAAGLTPDQLTAKLSESLSKFLKTPQVLVSVLSVNSKKYFITGEVNRPGSFPLVVPTHVLEALSNAGGFRDFANQKKIFILRKGQKIKFNYKDVIQGKNMEQNILIENGDYIIVP